MSLLPVQFTVTEMHADALSGYQVVITRSDAPVPSGPTQAALPTSEKYAIRVTVGPLEFASLTLGMVFDLTPSDKQGQSMNSAVNPAAYGVALARGR